MEPVASLACLQAGEVRNGGGCRRLVGYTAKVERVMILARTGSYRVDDFVAAARRLGVEPVVGTDRCAELAQLWDAEAFGSVEVPLDDLVAAAAKVAASGPLAAVVATDDATSEVAARAAALLGLRGNAPEAARRAGNKRLLREALFAGGVRCPPHQILEPGAAATTTLPYPVVCKPLSLSASRGVIRADNHAELVAAVARVRAILATLRPSDDPDARRVLIERFAPGPEVAVELLLRAGRPSLLALFDKPDPLDGPFFEETLYITPSRHPVQVVAEVVATAAAAAAALGLVEGPVHAELRLSPSGVQVLEVAARSIGGLCGRVLRFGLGSISLEELVLAAALGRPPSDLTLVAAAGVLMIPIPSGGVLQGVDGVDAARAVAHIEDVVITARSGEVLLPLPEGNRYLGFVFARADTPATVENALRSAHAKLKIRLAPRL